MKPVPAHAQTPDVSFDGGDLDCGNGLLLLIRRHIDPMAPGQFLEIRSTETSVDEDLPAWCRLTGNELISFTRDGRQRSFLVCKGRRDARLAEPQPLSKPSSPAPAVAPPPLRRAALAIPPLAVMGIGSWPRPRWMIAAMHAHVEGRLAEPDFHEAADDAVRLAGAAQERAGVDVLTDGE